MSTLDSAPAEPHLATATATATATVAPPAPSHVQVGSADVPLVRWPEDVVLRDVLAAVGRPRLLLVGPGVAPPVDLDACEDWLRWPADPSELAVRASHLARRAGQLPVEPVELDRDGVLRRGARWVAITEAQVPVLRLLLENLDRVVRFDDLVEAYAAGGGSRHHASVRTVLSRLGERVRPVGLALTTIRRRGYVLRAADGTTTSTR